ncbi:hypothetical protein [Vaginella massiliensis]|uniref:hypothetical protein n=1 Tax=Vaginella massiliensis TaxID=1816680 RepID=UPI000B05A17C|nr:hypothetical protein [Vaginella massiliensis]
MGHYLFHRLAFAILFLMFVTTQAQEEPWKNSNQREQTFLAKDTVQLDWFGILPEKISLFDAQHQTINPSFYRIDFEKQQLIIDSVYWQQPLTFRYFVDPKLVQKEVFAKDPSLIIQTQNLDEFHRNEDVKFKKETNELFEGLESKGSLVRGIRFGNNQSASTQSSLDLQLSGKLTEDVTVTAAIADNNVPIESDGYTQSLQEFDKVYIELATPQSRVRAGHIDLEQEQDYFNNFRQKVTGLLLETNLTSEKSQTKIFASGSITRGEFYSESFNGQDGNQGPYQLRGNHNELYVIIISGSERIYIDGILQERGEDKDYVINYNTGELTFTSNRLITSNSRIAVEYLYNSRNYSQLFLYGGVEHESEKLSVAGHFYSKSDAKKNTLSSELTDEDKQILSEAGNDPDLMYSVSAIRSDYDSNKVLYRKVYQNNELIFEYSNDPAEELYQVSFLHVGVGQGNYRQINTTQNGKVFEYVAPVAGVLQGDYEPIKRLIAPTKLQIYTLNSQYKFDENQTVGIDLALSNQDLNLFSNLDDEQNVGFAGRVYGEKKFDFEKWQITPKASVEYWQKNFVSPERVRAIEFERTFNVDSEFMKVDHLYFSAGLEVFYNKNLGLSYGAEFLEYKTKYRGLRHDFSSKYETAQDKAIAKLSYLATDKVSDETNFVQYDADYVRKLSPKYWIGTKFYGEQNEWKSKTTGLLDNSFRWNEFQLKAGRIDSVKMNLEMILYTRKDDSVRLANWHTMQRSNGVIFNSRLLNEANHQLAFNFHFRNVNYRFEQTPNENFMTGNLKWYKSFLRNGLQLNVDYELGSGVEAQREFQYIRVADGMGIYKWTDYNNDGIEQIDEFEMAEFIDQANYVRVYTNTFDYIKTNKNKLSVSARFRPKDIFNTSNAFVERWLLQTSLLSTNSSLKQGDALLFNPFINTDETLGHTRNWRGIIYYNQNAQYRWQATYNFNQQTTKTYIYTGSEFRDQTLHNLKLKYRIIANFFANLELEKSDVQSDSETFVSRRFKLDQYKLSPSLELQNGTDLRSSLFYIYQHKSNVSGVEMLKQHELKTELQWNLVSKMSVLGNFSYINNLFEGNQESVVGNQMMEGLRAGDNFVWQLQLQRQINSFLQLNLSYDGRKNENSSTIHTGSLQLQARF